MTVPSWEELPLHLIPTPTVFPVGPANVYFYPGPPVTLFDAGTNTGEAFDALIEGLNAAGAAINDIDQVILTHHHLDHIGLLRRIKEASGARILAHREVPARLPSITSETILREHLELLLAELGAPPDILEAIIQQRMLHLSLIDEVAIDEVFEEGDAIGPFTVHFRPGHSSTDCVFTHDSMGWAVTGDHLIHKITPNPLLRWNPALETREKSLVQYYESLLKTRALETGWCFAGHGAPFHNHRQAVDSTIQHIERRGERTLKALPDEGATPYEMTRKIFPHLTDVSFYYCLSAVTGYLDFLEMQGKACRDRNRFVPIPGRA